MKKNPAYTGAAAEEREYEIVAVLTSTNPVQCSLWKSKTTIKKTEQFSTPYKSQGILDVTAWHTTLPTAWLSLRVC